MGELERKKKQMQAQESRMPRRAQEKRPGLLHLQSEAGNRAVTNRIGSHSGVPEPNVVRTALGVTATIYFAQNSAFLNTANYQAVESVARELSYLLNPMISVDGHASGEGNASQNQSISEHRRQTVLALLTANLKSAPDAKGAAWGETKLAVPEETETGQDLEQKRALNRRVEITIVYNPSTVTKPKQPAVDLRLGTPRMEPPPTNPFDLKIPPAIQRPKISITGEFNKKFNEVTDKVLDELNIKKPWMRTVLKKGAQAAIEKGTESLLDKAMDEAGLRGNTREALKKGLEAGLKLEF